MSFWSSLWSAPETVSKAVDAAIATGDKLVLTEEERLDYRKELGEWYLRWLQVSSGSDLARRLIALVVIFLFAILVLVIVVLYILGAATTDVATVDGTTVLVPNVWLVVADKILGLASTVVLPIVVTVIGFYFTVRAVTNFARKGE